MLITFAADAATADEACTAIVNMVGKGDVKGISKDERKKALQTAAEKSKSAGTKKRADDALKGIK
jgi:ApbE superfamily uncharacterized protein (UPF0280 family)